MNPFRRALILDLDFTLLHLEAVPGAIEVPGRTRSAWVAPGTIGLLGELQTRFDLVLATARSWDGTRPVSDGLRARGVSVSGLVIEDGALWGDAGEQHAFDPSFHVEAVRAQLENLAPPISFEWQFDFEGCVVARAQNGEAAAQLMTVFAAHQSLAQRKPRFFRDGRKVYVLPREADKWSALRRLLGAGVEVAAGAGDGANDLVWLPRVGFPCTFARAHARLVAEVRARGGFVTASDGHAGIAAILQRIAGRGD